MMHMWFAGSTCVHSVSQDIVCVHSVSQDIYCVHVCVNADVVGLQSGVKHVYVLQFDQRFGFHLLTYYSSSQTD